MNYTIRLDGALWIKDILLNQHATVRGTSRYESVYLPEI